jgi:hypothetical protein
VKQDEVPVVDYSQIAGLNYWLFYLSWSRARRGECKQRPMGSHRLLLVKDEWRGLLSIVLLKFRDATSIAQRIIFHLERLHAN